LGGWWEGEKKEEGRVSQTKGGKKKKGEEIRRKMKRGNEKRCIHLD
jgi:hypothetical protein